MFYSINRSKASKNPQVRAISTVGSWFDSTALAENVRDIITLYSGVPVLHRAVDIRAKTLSSLPFDWYRGNKKLERPPLSLEHFSDNLTTILYETEMHMCLYGAAYLLYIENEHRRNPSLENLLPAYITPYYNVSNEVEHFIFNAHNVNEKLTTDDMLVIWLPNAGNVSYPGVSPAQVAFLNAYALYNLDTYTKRFFENGAMRTTLLRFGTDDPLMPQPSQEEVSRLTRMWNNFIAGTRNAYRALVLPNEVKPEVVGDGLGEMDIGSIAEQKSHEICVALGIPTSLIYANAANYATSRQDYLTFYQNTILPEAAFILNHLNTSFLAEFGYEIRVNENRLEVFQAYEFEKAQSLLAISPYLTTDEIREAFGYPPIADLESENQQAYYADSATRSMKLSLVDTMSDRELRFYNRLARVLSPQLPKATQAILNNANYDISQISEDILLFLLIELEGIYIDEADNIVLDTKIPIPVERLATDASEFARTHSYDLIKGLEDTTRDIVQRAQSAYMSTPGMTRADLERKLSAAFSKTRASAIAVTETTRAAAASATSLQDYYRQEHGLEYRRIWNTNADDLTCPICGPRDGKSENELGEEATIPAHVNCRCFWTLELVG